MNSKEIENKLTHIEEVTNVWRATGMQRGNAILRTIAEIRDLLADCPAPVYMVGQRVLVGGCIGTVVRPERDDSPNNADSVWVMNPLRGYASYYSSDNIAPLPNGQL